MFDRMQKQQIFKKSLIQWKLIDAIGDTALFWLAVYTFLLWSDRDISVFSITGISFFALGLLLLIEIFGVLNFLTRRLCFFFLFRKYEQSRETGIMKKDIKRIALVCNVFWFPVLYFVCLAGFENLKQIFFRAVY